MWLWSRLSVFARSLNRRVTGFTEEGDMRSHRMRSGPTIFQEPRSVLWYSISVNRPLFPNFKVSRPKWRYPLEFGTSTHVPLSGAVLLPVS